MEEFIKSIKAQLYDRTTSPLSGSFILSWALWNYKTLFVLFSSMKVDEKFNYISTSLYQIKGDPFITALFLPLLTTLFFIFIYPYPAKYVYGYWRNRQKELMQVRQKIEDETPLTLEKSRELRRNAIRLKTAYEKEIDQREDEINTLKESLRKEQESTKIDIQNSLLPYFEDGVFDDEVDGIPVYSPKATRKDGSAKAYDFEENLIPILKLIARITLSTGNEPSIKEVIDKSEYSNESTALFLKYLQQDGYLEINSQIVSITHKGSNLIIEKGNQN